MEYIYKFYLCFFNGTKLKEDAYFYVIKFNKDGALPIRGYVSIVR